MPGQAGLGPRPRNGIGQIGVGKTSRARVLTGLWRPANGTIRLDDSRMDQCDPAALGRCIGYLPQRAQLFGGTIAENIARLPPSPDDAAVVTAARKVAAHGMIVQLPEGYGAQVSATRGDCFRAARSSESDWPGRCTETRCFWFSTSRTRISTPTERRP